jgi:predicted nucleotidyltransferase
MQRLYDRLASVFDELQQRFPGCVIAGCLFGSQVEATAVEASDIDVCIIADVRDTSTTIEDIKLAVQAAGSEHRLPRLDVIVLERHQLLSQGHYRIKACSQWVFGDDIRGAMPELPFPVYLRTYVQAPVVYIVNVLRQADHVVTPVTVPDPAGRFLGYDVDRFPPTMEPIPNIHALVSTACWIASLLVSFATGQPIPSKHVAVTRYRTQVGDEWARFVDELYHFGKHTVGYLVPETTEHQQRLSRLCGQMVAFENHFLVRYREYLLAELQETERAARIVAAQRFKEVRYVDDDTRGVLQQAARRHTHDPELRDTILDALQVMGQNSP